MSAGGRASRVGRAAVAAGLLMLPLGCAAPPLAEDARIDFQQEKVSEHPRSWAAHARLGEAYLARARRTHDPDDVRRARESLDRSLEIQPNYGAMRTMAALCNFAHRFEDALDWCTRAERALPGDSAVAAQRVEAYLGLGRLDEAAAFVSGAPAPEDFFLLTARGRWLAETGSMEESAEAFARAASVAGGQRSVEAEVWALVSAAGVLLDGGRTAQARPYLDAARDLSPDDARLRLHAAEALAATGAVAEALATYERLLDETPDPMIHAAAFEVAVAIGDERRARRHLERAEHGFLRAIDAGEVYTLGALARLYLAAGANLDRARALARRNLEYERTAGARRLLESLEGGAAGPGAESG